MVDTFEQEVMKDALSHPVPERQRGPYLVGKLVLTTAEMITNICNALGLFRKVQAGARDFMNQGEGASPVSAGGRLHKARIGVSDDASSCPFQRLDYARPEFEAFLWTLIIVSFVFVFDSKVLRKVCI